MSADTGGLCLLLRVAGQRCALPLGYVEETMRPQPVQTVAGLPSYVRGVAMIRGMAAPVVDAAVLLDEQRTSTICTRFVIVKLDDRRVALAVDAVDGITRFSKADFSELPALLRAAEDRGIVAALGFVDRELLLVLQSSRFVPEQAWRTLDAGGAND
jgi:purine-binding chemotaxis protein CheW